MAVTFHSGNTELDTTGSPQTMLRCPTGKTLLMKTLWIRNADASATTIYVAIEDNSISTTSYPIAAKVLSAGQSFYSTLPRVLEENDELLVQTSQANQHIHVSYALIDSGTYTRYRGGLNNVTTEDQDHTVIVCPTGSTLLVNLMQFHNRSGSTASDCIIKLVDAAGTYEIDKGDLASAATATYKSTIVLEEGETLKFFNTEQPFTATACYMELRNPPTRA